MLAIGKAVVADIVDGAALAEAGQHIGQRPPGRAVHQHIADCDHRQAGRLRHLGQAVQPFLVASVIDRGRAEEALPGKAGGDAAEAGVCPLPFQRIGRQGDQDHPPAPVLEVGAG
jgi:hypothetical protein